MKKDTKVSPYVEGVNVEEITAIAIALTSLAKDKRDYVQGVLDGIQYADSSKKSA